MTKVMLRTLFGVCLVMLFAVPLAGCDRSAEQAAADEATATQHTKATIAPEDRDPNRLWCNEHGLYEDECEICHPEIAEKEASTETSEARDPNRLWCNEHGVYEDECVICHPEIAEKKASAETSEARDPNRLWCHEHGLYEDECVICHPELAAAPDEQSAGAGGGGLFCNEHGVLEIECGICHPEQLAKLSPGQGLKVRFASESSPSKAGVATGTPSSGAAGSTRALLGQVTFNRNRLAYVTPPASGIVTEVIHDVGAPVEQGDVLAMVESAELAEAMSAFVTATAHAQVARQALARERDLYEQEISARQDYEEAQAAVTSEESEVMKARQRLITLGVPEQDIESLSANSTKSSAFPVRAPLAGTVIARDAVQGMRVEPGQAMFQVADLSSVWMNVSVPENQLRSTPVGAPVQARFEAYPGVAFEGEIAWIAPTVDPQTRMVQARVVLPNPQELLKDGLFGRADLSGFTERAGLTVPESAVQDVDGRQVIFAKLDDDLYETRLVDVGDVRDGHAVVLVGLNAHDEIVTDGSYIVKSEMLKARLGAGCTDH